MKTFNVLLSIIFILIIVSCAEAQDDPAGRTTHYQIRMWNEGDNPSADSLNQNWIDLDSLLYDGRVFVDTTTYLYVQNDTLRFDYERFASEKLTSVLAYEKTIYQLNTAIAEDTSGTSNLGHQNIDETTTGWFLNGVEGITQEFDYIAYGQYLVDDSLDINIYFKSYVYVDNLGTDIIYDFAYLRFYVSLLDGTEEQYAQYNLLSPGNNEANTNMAIAIGTGTPYPGKVIRWKVYGYLVVQDDGTQTSNDMHVIAPRVVVRSKFVQQ